MRYSKGFIIVCRYVSVTMGTSVFCIWHDSTVTSSDWKMKRSTEKKKEKKLGLFFL